MCQKMDENRKCRFLYEQASVMYHALDEAGRVIDINPAWQVCLGYAPQEVVGKPFDDLMLPQGQIIFQKKFTELQSTCEKTLFSLVLLRENQDHLPVEIAIHKDTSAEHTFYHCVLHDIRERKERTRMVEQNARYRTYIENAPEGIIVMDTSARYVDTNETMSRMTGYSKSELLRMKIGDLVKPEDQHRSREAFAELKKAGTIHREIVLLKKDGSELPVSIKAVSLSTERFMAFCWDITQRKASEEKLRASEARNLLLFETMTQGIVFQNPDGYITLANPAAEEILGLTFDQMQGRTSYDSRWRSIREDGTDLPGHEHPSMIALKIGQKIEKGIMGVFNPKKEAITWIRVTAVPLFKKGHRKPYQVYTIFDDITDRINMENQLKEHQRLLDKVGDIAQIGGWENDMISKESSWTKGTYDILEMEYDKPVPGVNEFLNLYAPEFREMIRQKMDTIITTRRSVQYEAIIQTPQGARKWCEVIAEPLVKNGRVVKLRGTVQDISKRKKLEETMRIHSMTLDQIHDLVTMTDLNGTITYVNEANCRLLGKHKEELVGGHITSLGDPQQQQDILRTVLTDGYWQGESVNYHTDGTAIILESRVQTIKDDQGRPIALCGFSTDVTERKEIEQELDQYREHLERLVQERTQEITRTHHFQDKILSTIPIAVVVVDHTAHVLSFNKKYLDMFGLTSSSLKGKHMCQLIGCRWYQKHPCELLTSLNHSDVTENRFLQFEQTVEFKDARAPKVLRIYASRILDEKTPNQQNQILLAIEDITDRKSLEKQLMQNERLAATGRLAASIAHEINNPLQGISTHLDLLRSGLPKDSKRLKNYEHVRDNVKNISRIVSQLLNIYRSDTKQDKKPMNINRIIQQVLTLVDNQRRMRNVTVETHMADALPAVPGHEHQMHQVILNIVLNAIESLPRAGTIDITTQSTENSVIIAVKDNGAGMSQHDLDHIFDPFYSTKKDSGVGLGLFVCQGLIKNHDGRIRVQSQVDQGSTFTITIPFTG
jgi:PAS domain S-box-containing protein